MAFDAEAEARRQAADRDEKASELAFKRGQEVSRVNGLIADLERNVHELRTTTSRTDAKVERLEDGVDALKSAMERKDAVAEALGRHLDQQRQVNKETREQGVSARMFWVGVATVVVMVLTSLVVPLVIHALQAGH